MKAEIIWVGPHLRIRLLPENPHEMVLLQIMWHGPFESMRYRVCGARLQGDELYHLDLDGAEPPDGEGPAARSVFPAVRRAIAALEQWADVADASAAKAFRATAADLVAAIHATGGRARRVEVARPVGDDAGTVDDLADGVVDDRERHLAAGHTALSRVWSDWMDGANAVPLDEAERTVQISQVADSELAGTAAWRICGDTLMVRLRAPGGAEYLIDAAIRRMRHRYRP